MTARERARIDDTVATLLRQSALTTGQLADRMRVSRRTVLRSYARLRAAGWVFSAEVDGREHRWHIEGRAC